MRTFECAQHEVFRWAGQDSLARDATVHGQGSNAAGQGGSVGMETRLRDAADAAEITRLKMAALTEFVASLQAGDN